MSVQLYLAPAAAGKTAHLLNRARRAAIESATPVRVLVPTGLQARAWRRRLAEAGGSFGVRVQIFDQLYADVLLAAGQPATELSEPVQYRLLQAMVDDLPLQHYAAITSRPGFIQLLQQRLAELKAARIQPDHLADAIAALGSEPRLAELAQIYAAYQQRLHTHRWADRAGRGWLALDVLESAAPLPALDDALLLVDGFDNFTEIQIDALAALANRADTLLITLTGASGDPRPLAHRRFNQTRRRLEDALGLRAEPLPAPSPQSPPALAHLEAGLFQSGAPARPSAETISLIEAPDRAAEVRAALRWLKAQHVEAGAPLSQLALLARSVGPYRPFISQLAREFGLPVQFLNGEPLRGNPAIAALLDLLRLARPDAARGGEPALPYRLVSEAWSSPYFDWSARPTAETDPPIGIGPGDAHRLQAAARFGQVVGGLSQWREALTALAERVPPENDDDPSPELPSPDEAQRLQASFERFVQRLTPPADACRTHDFAQWLEDLIGPDPDADPRFDDPPDSAPTALNLVARARAAETTAARDIAALQSLKEVLRGLVWAEEALDRGRTLNFSQFFDDLTGAIDAAGYALPQPDGPALLVADVVQARGVPLQAVAVLGLAEGEFPAVLGEDPLLRNADRQRLQQHGIALDLPTDSAEVEFFYETITRPWAKLLLTRPRLADNGSTWQASPYWEEVRRLVSVTPDTLTGDGLPTPDRAASWAELLESLSSHPGHSDLWQWAQQTQPARLDALDTAAGLFGSRQSRAAGSPFDGDLRALEPEFAAHFGPNHTWSASRLESYRACPFMFFVSRVLKLEPRAEPDEGLDAAQLGSIYHRIFEQVYRAAPPPARLDDLLAALPGIAAQILDDAPRRDGFRATAWWAETRREIIANVETSLRALAELADDFVPVAFEQGFFKGDALRVPVADDSFRLHGVIDRVDRNAAGEIRLIDYKTGGPYSFNDKAFRDGKKLQLPLYALAAQAALGLGPAADGFYWHVRHAEASPFSLARFKAESGEIGPMAAIRTATDHAWEAILGVRAGHFSPQPPPGGCPAYCPAAAFCWRYSPGFGG